MRSRLSGGARRSISSSHARFMSSIIACSGALALQPRLRPATSSAMRRLGVAQRLKPQRVGQPLRGIDGADQRALPSHRGAQGEGGGDGGLAHAAGADADHHALFSQRASASGAHKRRLTSVEVVRRPLRWPRGRSVGGRAAAAWSPGTPELAPAAARARTASARAHLRATSPPAEAPGGRASATSSASSKRGSMKPLSTTACAPASARARRAPARSSQRLVHRHLFGQRDEHRRGDARVDQQIAHPLRLVGERAGRHGVAASPAAR